MLIELANKKLVSHKKNIYTLLKVILIIFDI